ncbi:MAG TPA: hypothetical protein VL360_04305 [Gammaproteobacteria bacterium]|jgi:hypothetical protein|nr:hypothetical protein [Gammaproteobacteria bacterium]
MKIKVIDSNTKKPVINTKIPLHVKGENSGFLSLTTDGEGMLQMDNKYQNQQITSPMSGGNGTGNWVTATDNAVLLVTTKQKATIK